MKQTKVLGISQAGYHLGRCVCDSGTDGLGIVTEITEGESTPRILVPALEVGRYPIYPIEQQLLAVYTELLQIEPLMKEQRIMVRTSFPMKGWWVENTFYPPTSAMAHTPRLTEWPTCSRQAPCPPATVSRIAGATGPCGTYRSFKCPRPCSCRGPCSL